MNTFKSLSGWRRRSLAELGHLPDEIVRQQRQRYIQWLRDTYHCSEEDAELLVQVQRDAMEAVVTEEPPAPSRVREERWFNDRVCIRTVKVYHTKEHWEHSARRYGTNKHNWYRAGSAEWHWARHDKPDYPTVYEVVVDGRRHDGFLTLSRAKACAELVAKNKVVTISA